jgi:uncharacterized NAD(P)/FAD-binding protein YdhS
MKTIAIVGGGFCGTITAVNLVRLSREPLQVRLINDGFPTGRGIAYGTRRGEHLLNVVARNMSALSDQPNHFVDWLRSRSEFAELPDAVLRETFVPRRTYGDYLSNLLHWFTSNDAGRAHVRVERIQGRAVDVLTRDDGADVLLQDGGIVSADRVLLATGNLPPADMTADGAPFEHPRYFANPWTDWENRLPEDRNTPIVLLGTGLTMIDALLTLWACGWRGPITAVSRSGRLPESHFRGIEYTDFPPENVASLGLEELASLVHEHCGRLRDRGANPAIVVDKLRPYTQRIWQNLSVAEKQEFCRKYRSQWNVIRHRVAPQLHEQVVAAQNANRLHIARGAVCGVSAAGDGVAVELRDADGQTRMLEAGIVINCTGPLERFSAAASPLYETLCQRGTLALDELDMGIRVDPDFAILDHTGERSDVLFAIGPLLKGTLWETTAVPELRGQAYRAAQSLLETTAPVDAIPRVWPMPTEMELLEYCI